VQDSTQSPHDLVAVNRVGTDGAGLLLVTARVMAADCRCATGILRDLGA
jgi:hypothetical protein